MIIDNILSTLVQDHPDLLDTFEGGDWDKLVDGGYPEEVVIPVLRNIVEHAHYRGYLGERVVLLRKFGIYTLGKETLNGWQGFEIPMLNGESEILKEAVNGEPSDEGQHDDEFDEEGEEALEHHLRQENMKKSGFLGIPTKHYVIAGVVLCSAIIGFTLLNGGKPDNQKRKSIHLTVAQVQVLLLRLLKKNKKKKRRKKKQKLQVKRKSRIQIKINVKLKLARLNNNHNRRPLPQRNLQLQLLLPHNLNQRQLHLAQKLNHLRNNQPLQVPVKKRKKKLLKNLPKKKLKLLKKMRNQNKKEPQRWLFLLIILASLNKQ